MTLRHEGSRGVGGCLPGGAAPADLFEDLRGGFVAAVFVVPIPPFVRLRLRVALRRVLPLLLASQRCNVEIVPGVPHLLVAAVVYEIGAEHAIAVPDERVGAVPLVYAEIFIEVTSDCVPRDMFPAHAPLEAFDVRLRRPRRE